MAELNPVTGILPPASVTDKQVAALRAYLALDLGRARQLYDELAQSGGLGGYPELILAAFVLAAQRQFAPRWTRADVVRFVAATRSRLPGDADIDPLAAEMIIRVALGESAAVTYDEDTQGAAQIILLPELMVAQEPDDAQLDAFMATARARADMLLASRAAPHDTT